VALYSAEPIPAKHQPYHTRLIMGGCKKIRANASTQAINTLNGDRSPFVKFGPEGVFHLKIPCINGLLVLYL